MNKSTVKAFFAVALLAQASFAFAGAGANVNVCLNLATKPAVAYTAAVTPGNSSNSQCINDYGSSATINVTSAGLNCASVGYVEAKASSTKGDFCATSASYWQISYQNQGAGGGASGSAQVNITTSNTGSNSASLSNQQKSTNMCGSLGVCSGTDVSWPHGNVGGLYVIFVPGGN